MRDFLLGLIIGMSILTIYTWVYPLGIRAVTEELVKLDHGYYDSKTKKFILKECK